MTSGANGLSKVSCSDFRSINSVSIGRHGHTTAGLRELGHSYQDQDLPVQPFAAVKSDTFWTKQCGRLRVERSCEINCHLNPGLSGLYFVYMGG